MMRIKLKTFTLKTVICVGMLGLMHSAFSAGTAVCEKPTKSILIGHVTCNAEICKLSGGSSSSGLGALLQLAQANGSIPNAMGLTNDLATILSASLRETKCFNVIEQEGIEQAKSQMQSIGKTFVPPHVDYIVNASISEVETNENQQNILFAKVGSKSAKLTMSTKIVDPNTGSTLDGKSYTSTTSDAAARFEVGGLLRIGQGDNQLGLTDLVRDTSNQAAQDIAMEFK